MDGIILDCNLMRYPHSGLYQYCLNLGERVNTVLKKQNSRPLRMYLPSSNILPYDHRYHIIERSWHRYWKPFLSNCRIWHAPFQSGRILPDARAHKHIKVVLTIHDLNSLHEGKPKKEQEESLFRTQRLIDRSDAIICISEFTKDDVYRNCVVGDKPVYVIHNGIHKLVTPALGKSSYRPLRPFIFGMGYINRKKNYHVLVDLVERNPGLELIIAGRLDEPDYVDHIRAKAEKLGISEYIRLLGPVSEPEKAWYLNHCIAFMQPSLAEGFGAPVVEAMQFGKPIFLSNLTSLPEIGGETAFYFSNFEADHMHGIFSEGMLCYKKNNMTESIIRRGKNFEWGKSAQKYLDVYKSLL
jgi:glycosyltransferase involved in cell wall biosynthesis